VYGPLTRSRRWFCVGITLKPDKRYDLSVTMSELNLQKGNHGKIVPGSAITTRSGLPDGDHLSTAKNCSPVRDNSLGPNECARAEKKFGYRGRPM
jgi:hypothetical protein